jgi:redox-sensitive bicupin YhaK (pirin superfamily)
MLTPRTGIEVQRLLPQATLRKIGAWVFLDHFGPTEQDDAMVVGAHPHTGLQTATWILEGEVEHRDSLGTVQMLKPGQLNLMTAGRGIAHSELSVSSSTLHAVQLWIALPDAVRNMKPEFEHIGDLPMVHGINFTAKVIVGEFAGAHSPAKVHSPLVGVELTLTATGMVWFPANPDFEYGFLSLDNQVEVDGNVIEPGELAYSAPGKELIVMDAPAGSRFIVIGGKPFNEQIVMWWNFIARSHAEIVGMRDAWNHAAPIFAAFEDRINQRLLAPELPNAELKPRL